jgi:hypothetical protein
MPPVPPRAAYPGNREALPCGGTTSITHALTDFNICHSIGRTPARRAAPVAPVAPATPAAPAAPVALTASRAAPGR